MILFFPVRRVRLKRLLCCLALLALSCTGAAAAMSDAELFSRLNLDYPGMEKVSAAVAGGDIALAKRELGAYYRTRSGQFHPEQENMAPAQTRGARLAVESLLKRTGSFDAALWSQGNRFDWGKAKMRMKERMYGFETFGKAAAGDANVAQALIGLIDSFIEQYPRPDGKAGGMWATMNTGIRMRSGWPVAFMGLLQSAQFDDEHLAAFLKSVWEQTDHLMQFRSETSNWLTFEMAGLYTSGIVYPEFADAPQWRQTAVAEALADMQRGWLPDGVTIELTPAYGSFFSNYLTIYDLAESVGRVEESGIAALLPLTENAFASYLGMVTPEFLAPATNDNGPANVSKIMAQAVQRFPLREDFRWAASKGAEGTPPSFTSYIFPYAGFAALRSGWQSDANMLYFDFGPVGYRHAHQDKLGLMLWAYGRPVMTEQGLSFYDHSNPYVRYAMDTFSHSTGLVDNRPQRRNWYQSPHPRNIPYRKVEDSRQWDAPLGQGRRQWFVSGEYDEAYGLPGASSSYPYSKGSDFRKGWGYPATHSRRVLFAEPDIFVVADTFTPKEPGEHTYDVRWHLNSPQAAIADDGFTVITTDAGQPNVELAPLRTAGLEVGKVSAQSEPELMGWQIVSASDIRPATTVRHIRHTPQTAAFLTLLLPLKPGQEHLLKSVRAAGADTFVLTLEDGRSYELYAPEDPAADLRLTPLADAATAP